MLCPQRSKSVKKPQRKEGQGGTPSPKRDQKSRGKRRKENALIRYFRQTWTELRKVNWPERHEARNLTMIVLIVTVGMSAFLGVIDWLFALFFSWIVQLSG